MRSFLLFFILICTLLFSTALPVSAQTELQKEIERITQQGGASLLKLRAHGYESKALDETLSLLYKERSYSPFWIEQGTLSKRAMEMKQAILESVEDGLNPEDYFIKLIEARWEKKDTKSQAELDALLTVACARLAADASEGRIEPHDVDAKEFVTERPERPNLDKIVREVLQSTNLKATIRAQFPQHRQYHLMRSALAAYRTLEAQGGWQPMKTGPSLKTGASGERVSALFRRLQLSGDLANGIQASEQFDEQLALALKKFQGRHGIEPTGVLDSATISALNVPINKRIQSLLINLERWRWLHHGVSDGKEVLVNIAGYELFAINASEIVFRLPIIVGKTYHSTPVFSDLIRSIELNPYWNVPPSIAANEMLPKLRKNRAYLTTQHMRLYEGGGESSSELAPTSINWSAITPAQMRRYSIKQDPGPWNALGKFKFMFPNKYNVYLHDTSAPELFSQTKRAFSHGCIRVSTPEKLAAFLLDAPEAPVTVERVQEYVSSGKNQWMKLPTPARVHLTYRTAWVEHDGTVQFRPDLYGRDAKMARVMFP